MLYILKNLKRSNNQWVYRNTSAVKKVLVQRRVDFKEMVNIEETIKICAAENGVILIPNAMSSPTIEIVEKCNKAGVQVILPRGFLNFGERYRYNCVMGDVFSAIAKILYVFRGAGKVNVALYGTNVNSQDDVLLTDAFLAQNSFADGVVFCNDGSISTCFDNFFSRKPFDAVICANDYVALHLINTLRERNQNYLERLSIVSFSNTFLSYMSRIPFTSLTPDLNAVANAVVDIYKIVNREKKLYCALMFYVEYQIFERQTTRGLSFHESNFSYENQDVFFPTVRSLDESNAYDASPEIAKISKIDLFLNHLTNMDFSILMRAMKGQTWECISEEMFISRETVSYHLKKMRTGLNCNSTKELCSQLGEIVIPRHIENFLEAQE